jgi:cytoskeletal protein CcmA (bactofilin family)
MAGAAVPSAPRARTSTGEAGARSSGVPGEGSVSLVPIGGRFEGLMAVRGDARLDGEHQGLVRVEGTLWIGRSGRLVGDVEADELQVAGTLEGRATARRLAVLEEGATVRGTLQSPLLVMREGAVLEGDCKTGAIDSVS